ECRRWPSRSWRPFIPVLKLRGLSPPKRCATNDISIRTHGAGVLMISAVDLYKSFRLGQTDIHVLNGVSLEIKRGEIVAIVGASGVGKTTLLHILGTLDRPTRGTVRFDGEEVFRLMRDLNRAKGVTFVIVTHNEALSNQADRILRMVDGKIA